MTNADYAALYGATLFIGRNPQGGGLRVRLERGTTRLAFTLAAVTGQSVTRCTDDKAHCRLTVDTAGRLSVTNLSPQNVTYVNDTEVVTKHLTTADDLTLGSDCSPVRLTELLDKAVQTLLKKAPEAAAFSLAQLEAVWDDYHRESLNLKLYQRKVGLMRSVPMMFTLGSGSITALTRVFTWPEWVFTLTIVMTISGFALMVYGFYLSVTDRSIERGEALLRRFQGEYICPNPACRHFMGMQPFHLLRQNKKCPYCGCGYK